MPSKQFLRIIPLIFWLFIITIKLIRIIPFYEGEELVRSLKTISITTPLDIISFAFFYYLIVPRFIYNKQRVVYSFLAILFFAIYGLIYSSVYYLTDRIDNYSDAIMIYKSSLGHTILAALYAIVLGLSVDWFRKYQKTKELEKANLVTELALLRSQINPHFLFNTLNNINSFTTTDPEKTSFAIIKLSDIMRYMLYDASSDKVLLEKEIDYIENFISLQRLRYKENDFVKFTVEGITAGVIIPPMIFLPFIENAFKHGTVSVKDSIVIDLSIVKHRILFNCKNRVKKSVGVESENKSGLGIKNIKRRLELLYPGKHELLITEPDDDFIVNLIIDTDEY